ncbi:MAG: heme exporter protein CcmB [Alphaproteobacteria bacterium GM7ARS4]|nr:heme exporter protein CcmB [Alphaproteobacteria bacterium GM7ARS4]
MFQAFSSLFLRDLKRCLLNTGQSIVSLLFFMTIMVFFPLSLDMTTINPIDVSPAVIWVGMFFASQLPLERLFHDDYKDGSLALWTLTYAPIELIALAKCLAAWCSVHVPMLIASVACGYLLYHWHALPPRIMVIPLAGMVIGSMLMSLVSCLASSLTLGSTHIGKALPAFIAFPLSLPIMILGAGALTPYLSDGTSHDMASLWTPLWALLAIFLASAIPLLWAITASLHGALTHQS